MPLRQLIGPLWTTDMLDIFGPELLRTCGTISPRALEFLLEPEGFRRRDGDGVKPTGYRGTYERSRLGRIPRDCRLQLIAQICPQALRVLAHPICQVLQVNLAPSGEALQTVFSRLSPEVQKIIFYSGEDGLLKRRDWSIRYLEKLKLLGSIDALTALLILMQEDFQMTPPGKSPVIASLLRHYIPRVFIRVAVFTPFFEERERLYHYLKEYFYTCRGSVGSCRDWNLVEDTKALYALRDLLERMIELGLIGPTFQEQMTFINCCRSCTLEALSTIVKASRATKPFLVPRSSPLVQFLRCMHHPAACSKRIVLPWTGRRAQATRIVNAFGTFLYEAPREESLTANSRAENKEANRYRQADRRSESRAHA